MSYHHHPVLGQVDVCLDGMSADLDGAAEGPHCVLGEAGLVASVGHGLGEAMVDPRLGSSPCRCCRGLFLSQSNSRITRGKMSRSTWWDSMFVGVNVGVRLWVLRPVHHALT